MSQNTSFCASWSHLWKATEDLTHFLFFQQLLLATRYVIGIGYKVIDCMGKKPHFCAVHNLANSNLLFTTCQALNILFLLIFIVFILTLQSHYYYYPNFTDMDTEAGRLSKELKVETSQSCTHSWKRAFCTSSCSAGKGAGPHPSSWRDARAWALGPWLPELGALVPLLPVVCSLAPAAGALMHSCFPGLLCTHPSEHGDLTGVMQLTQGHSLYRNYRFKLRRSPLLHISQSGCSIYALVWFGF